MGQQENSSPSLGAAKPRPARAIARVDLGDELKAAAQAASDAAGVRLSEWFRRAVVRALPSELGEVPASADAVSPGRLSARAGEIKLDQALVRRMDLLVAHGRFRTRTGALRALLDGVPVGASSEALREASRALGESNFRLSDVARDLARVTRSISPQSETGLAHRMAIDRTIQSVERHLDIAARTLAGLRSQLLAKED